MIFCKLKYDRARSYLDFFVPGLASVSFFMRSIRVARSPQSLPIYPRVPSTYVARTEKGKFTTNLP
jgi:hypothetical protein